MNEFHHHRCPVCNHRLECDGDELTGESLPENIEVYPNRADRFFASLNASAGCYVTVGDDDCPNCVMMKALFEAEELAEAKR